MSTSLATALAAALLGLPLAGAILNGLLGPVWGRRFVNGAGTLSILAAFVVALTVLINTLGADSEHRSVTVTLWQWLNLGAGNLRVGFDVTLDPLACVMIMVITGVGFLIHVYSVGYMEKEPGVARFFSYMNFFIFSMLLLVLAADMVILIIGWALVALSSYLLIGFWYQRPSAVAAARKAFITQVIGDVALVLAAFLILTNLQAPAGGGRVVSLSLPTVFANAAGFPAGGGVVTAICLLLAVGAFAKSAQFPLHTWLPDAMEGPTPVSALIHAATMVTAGVYLIARFHPLFDRSPVAQGVVACVGIGTAVMAGVIALTQIDIKRVIAYSTMSQIGLMIFATGIGAYTAAMFHFVTHAAFKALLFMAAGNVIHALHDEQDIRLMGGLSARMRRTELCFLSGTLALAGFPLLFAGWYSKEYLLGFAMTNGPASWLLYALGIGLNVLTGLYALRLWAVVFRGEAQTARVYAAHEAPAIMLGPVAVLAVLSVGLGVALQWPVGSWWHVLGDFLDPVFTTAQSGHIAADPGLAMEVVGLAVGTVASLIGLGAAIRMWVQRRPEPHEVAGLLPRFVPVLAYHKFYFDELYDATLVRPTLALARGVRRFAEPRVMDGWVRSVAQTCGDVSESLRAWQSGLLRDYATYMLGAAGIGVVAMLVVWAR